MENHKRLCIVYRYIELVVRKKRNIINIILFFIINTICRYYFFILTINQNLLKTEIMFIKEDLYRRNLTKNQNTENLDPSICIPYYINKILIHTPSLHFEIRL